MRTADEKSPTPSVEEKHAQRVRVMLVFRWVLIPIYAGVAIWLTLAWRFWPDLLAPTGLVIVAAYFAFRLTMHVSMIRLVDESETEWMRRGGLMATPQANARPDEARINAALNTLPVDFPPQARDAVEAYLAMADDDEKQLCRDKLIREFYEIAGSDKLDFKSRRAYNALRLALSPWSSSDSDT